MLDFTFHTDSAHGWLGVPITMIKDLNIQDEISHYSYLKNNMAYLEEDCDANVFLRALKAQGFVDNRDYIIFDEYKDFQPIRNYARFNKDKI